MHSAMSSRRAAWLVQGFHHAQPGVGTHRLKGRADVYAIILPFHHPSIVLRSGAEVTKERLTCATTACIVRSLDQLRSGTNWSPATSTQELEGSPRRRMRGPQFVFFRGLNSPSIRSHRARGLACLAVK